MGVMLARNQESGSSPVMSEFWKIRLRAGANSLAASWVLLPCLDLSREVV